MRNIGWAGVLCGVSACTWLRQGAPGAPVALQAQCTTAIVVSLKWTAASDAAHIAGYRIYRDGAVIGTTPTQGYSDTSVSGATAYDYRVAAFDSAGRLSDPAALTVTTASASPNGDAAYCGSQAIGSMVWHWSDGFSQANGSDLWPATWGEDGNVYLFFGDGGGFGGDNFLGRTSFGIARVSGKPPLDFATLSNVYGGYQFQHPARISGKASSIVAVGTNFYVLGGIYRPTDSLKDYRSQPAGSPNRVQLAYSLGNAYSWRPAGWTFCSADATGRSALAGTFCPMSFINYGPGNAGAPGGYVYVLGTLNSAFFWAGGIAPLPLNTYLARVPQDRVLTQSAYRYFAGLDRRGQPIWSVNEERMQPIFSDRNVPQIGCNNLCNMAGALAEVVYDAGLKRYIGIAQGDYLAQTAFYDAPAAWGPWTSIAYDNIDAKTGTGGWAHLGTAAGASLGMHPVNAWTSADGKTLWLTFSSNGKAPKDALFPPAGTEMDAFNLVSVSLQSADPGR
jgi:hypothetical protein